MSLSPTDREVLLRLARQCVELISLNPNSARGMARPADGSPQLDAPTAGAFVSIHRDDGALRGCIGCLDTHLPLWEAVADAAVGATCRDPRFPPVKPDEVPHLHIEISILSPFRPVDSVDEIVVGRDGLFVTSHHHRGLLLPQVATEHGWTAHQFVQHTLSKAGLHTTTPRRDYKLQSFTAEVFSETGNMPLRD